MHMRLKPDLDLQIQSQLQRYAHQSVQFAEQVAKGWIALMSGCSTVASQRL